MPYLLQLLTVTAKVTDPVPSAGERAKGALWGLCLVVVKLWKGQAAWHPGASGLGWA